MSELDVSFQKLLELEDAGEDERKDLHGQIESLESILRMLELKSKNSSDHGIMPILVLPLFGSFENISVLHLFYFVAGL